MTLFNYDLLAIVESMLTVADPGGGSCPKPKRVRGPLKWRPILVPTKVETVAKIL